MLTLQITNAGEALDLGALVRFRHVRPTATVH
jgi:hypothetical protein